MHSRRIECVKNVSKIIPLVSTMVRNSLNNTATNLRAMVFPISNHRQKLPRFGNQKNTLICIDFSLVLSMPLRISIVFLTRDPPKAEKVPPLLKKSPYFKDLEIRIPPHLWGTSRSKRGYS